MGDFDAFIESTNDISAWVKWIHPGVPDEEGEEREQAEIDYWHLSIV